MNSNARHPFILLAIASLLLNASAASHAKNWSSETSLVQDESIHSAIPPEHLVGKVTLIDFWASWCGPCKASFPQMDLLQNDYRETGFQVIAVNQDTDRHAMERFLAKQNVSFETIHDSNHSIVKSAGIETFPTSFLVDKLGKVRFVHRGWHGKKSVDLLKEQIESLLSE